MPLYHPLSLSVYYTFTFFTSNISLIFRTVSTDDGESKKIVGLLKARKIAQAQATKQTEIDIAALKKYEDVLKSGNVTTEAEEKALKGASDAARKHATEMKNGGKSAEDFSKGLSKLTVKAKLAAATLNLLKGVGNIIMSWLGFKAFEIVSNVLEKGANFFKEFFIPDYKDSKKREKSADITKNYKEESSNLDSLIKKYTELNTKLKESSLTAEEYKQIKEELTTIQAELKDSFGDEAAGIDIVNGKYEEQLGLLSELSRKKAIEYVDQNKENIGADRKTANKKADIEAPIGDKESFAQYEHIFKKYSTLDLYDYQRDVYFTASGNLGQTYDEILLAISDIYEEYGHNNESANQLVNYLNEAKSKIATDKQRQEYDEAVERVKTYATAEILSSKEGIRVYENLTKSIEAYNEALANNEGVEEAKLNYETASNSFKLFTGTIENSDKVLAGLQENLSRSAEIQYNFNKAVENGSLDKILKRISTQTDEQLLNTDWTDGYTSAFEELCGTLSVTQDEAKLLIQILTDLGHTQSAYQEQNRLNLADILTPDVKDRYHNDITNFIRTLSDEDVTLLLDAELPEDVSTYTRKQLRDLIVKLNREAKVDAVKIPTILEITSAAEITKTALGEQKSNGYLSEETTKGLADTYGDLSNIIEYLPNGIKLNVDAINEFNKNQSEATLTTLKLKEALAVKEYQKETAQLKANVDALKKTTKNSKELEKAYKSGAAGLKKYISENKNLDKSLVKNIDDSLKVVQRLQDEINKYDQLENVILATTSALHLYQEALETPNDYDNFNTAKSGLEGAKKAYENGWTGTDDFKTYMDYIGGYKGFEDEKAYIDGAEQYLERAAKYLTDDISGIYAFLDDAAEVSLEKGAQWVTKQDDQYSIAIDNMNDFAQAMDTSISMATDILLAANDAWDFEVNFDNLTESMLSGIDEIDTRTYKARTEIEEYKESAKKLAEAGIDTSEIDALISEVESEYSNNMGINVSIGLSKMSVDQLKQRTENVIDRVQKDIEAKGLSIKLNLDSQNTNDIDNQVQQMKDYRSTFDIGSAGYNDANLMIATLIRNKQELEKPAIMSADTSKLDSETAGAVALIQEWVDAANELEVAKEIDMDTTDAQAKLENLTETISKLDSTTLGNLGLGDIEFTVSDDGSIEDIKSQIAEIEKLEPKNTIILEADDTSAKTTLNNFINSPKSTTVTIKAKLESDINDKIQATLSSRTYTLPVSPSFSGGNNGGSSKSDKADAHGSSGLPSNETALVGELGQELVVSGNSYYTVGDHGAEFVNLKRGDIVFDHEQTKRLLKNGYINSRADIIGGLSAFAHGNAYAKTDVSVSGGGSNGWSKKNGGSGSNNASSSSESGDLSSATEDAKEFEEELDWIVVGIQRCEEALERLEKVESNVFEDWQKRTEYLNKEMSQTKYNMEYLQLAYEEYMRAANAVDLSEVYKKKVREGKIQLETITDEKLKEAIEKYTKYYEAAISAKDKIDDLNISLSELAKKKFDNLLKQFEDFNSLTQNIVDQIESAIKLTTAKGYMISKSFYQNQRDEKQLLYDNLILQRDALTEELNAAVASGKVQYQSEAWFEMFNKIQDVTKQIAETEIEIQELSNTIRQIDWDAFDTLQEKISDITDEFEFLNDLLESKELTDAKSLKGLSKYGLTQLGHTAIEYDLYLKQAAKYKDEIAKIDKQIISDPNNVTLIKRREELAKQQRESIKNAESEKKAMIDLARKGYDAILKSLQEMINKRKDLLKAEKDLYDYQQAVTEKTKSVSDIQKQLAVYANDNSEESKKRVQELRNQLADAQKDLNDTKREKQISDQTEMLDKLYDDYSKFIDDKFENTDALFKELIGDVNKNASTIKTTVQEVAKDYNYQLSESAKTILDGSESLVSDFHKSFINATNGIDQALSEIDYSIVRLLNFAQDQAEKEEIEKRRNEAIKQEEEYEKSQGGSLFKDGIEFTKLSGDYTLAATLGSSLIGSSSSLQNMLSDIKTIPKFDTSSNMSGQLYIENIVLPDVENPEDFADKFVSTLKANPTMVKSIQSVTTDLLAGKSIKKVNRF